MRIIVLGAGLVGRPMAIDLAPEFDVTIADISNENLERIDPGSGIKTVCQDLSEKTALTNLISDFDLVINAVPGFMGFETLRTVIEAGKDVVEIAFSPEDVMELDELAKQNGVTAICDMGVAPGMSNVLIGHVSNMMEQTEKVRIYVGGLPKRRTWPFEYKAPFSPIDVIEEYTRPARVVENGEEVIKEALSEVELLTFDAVGTLEAFNSDGLRSLVHTIDAPDMVEKTLRYPGHAAMMKVFRETGFFSQDSVDVRGQKVRPIDLTAKLLFPKWELGAEEPELTIMQVIIEGVENGKRMRYTYDLYDEYDPETKTHSMARTTGYAATSAVRMFAEGLFTQKGVFVPEFIGKDSKCVEFILACLKERGIEYVERVEEI
ncbi:MAG: saccharopine dehydrogenase [Bacteroidetes bacterium]|nr:MAG: saccharopine dehydrogenase [Bacteroidota bacterium]